MPNHPTPSTEFPPITTPDGCNSCFFAQGVMQATNTAAAELRSGTVATEARYIQLKAAYVGGCLLRDDIEVSCGRVRLLYVEGEPMTHLCGYVRRQIVLKELFDRPERPLQQEL